MDAMWTIGAAAERLGLAVSTLRYWDERGVVRPSKRCHGKRVYDENELHRLAVVRLLRDSGMLSLEQIGAVVNGPAYGEDWRGAVAERLAEVRAQQARLLRAEAYLEHLRTCPSDDPVTQCSVLRQSTEVLVETGSTERASDLGR